MSFATYAGLFLIQLADALSLLYLAQTGTRADLAGLAIGVTVFFFAFVVNIGFAIAVGSRVSHVAVRSPGQLPEVVTSCIAITSIAASLISVVVFVNAATICSFFGATGEAEDVAVRYLSILVWVNGPQGFAMACAATMRATGNASGTVMSTSIGALATLVVDPILILVLSLGVDGAAIGIWIGRIIQVVVCLAILQRRRLWGRPSRESIAAEGSGLLGVALPSTVAALAPGISAAILMSVAARFGDTALSSIVLVDRLSAFAFGFTMTISGALSTIVGQNHAAGMMRRVDEATKVSALSVLAYCAATGLILILFGEAVLALAGYDEGTDRGLSRQYLSLSFIVWTASGWIGLASSLFQNSGSPRKSMYLNWFRATFGMAPVIAVGFVNASAELTIQTFVASTFVCGLLALAAASIHIKQLSTQPAN